MNDQWTINLIITVFGAILTALSFEACLNPVGLTLGVVCFLIGAIRLGGHYE